MLIYSRKKFKKFYYHDIKKKKKKNNNNNKITQVVFIPFLSLPNKSERGSLNGVRRAM